MGVVEKKLSEKSFRIRYINNSRTERCERSLEGISLLVKAEEAKKAGKCDVVIDPLFLSGPMVELTKDVEVNSQEEKEVIQEEDVGNDLLGVDSGKQETLQTDQIEELGNVEAPLPLKKPVVVQFVKRGKDVIRDIDQKKRCGKKM